MNSRLPSIRMLSLSPWYSSVVGMTCLSIRMAAVGLVLGWCSASCFSPASFTAVYTRNAPKM